MDLHHIFSHLTGYPVPKHLPPFPTTSPPPPMPSTAPAADVLLLSTTAASACNRTGSSSSKAAADECAWVVTTDDGPLVAEVSAKLSSACGASSDAPQQRWGHQRRQQQNEEAGEEPANTRKAPLPFRPPETPNRSERELPMTGCTRDTFPPPRPPDCFGYGRPARPAWRFLAAVRRYDALYRKRGFPSAYTTSPLCAVPAPAAAGGEGGDGQADEEAGQRPARPDPSSNDRHRVHQRLRELSEYLQYYLFCEREATLGGTLASPGAARGALERCIPDLANNPPSLRNEKGVDDWEQAEALRSAAQQLPTDLGHCMAIANALVRHLTILKTVPPPPRELLASGTHVAPVGLQACPAQHHHQLPLPQSKDKLLPYCPCGCVKRHVLQSEVAHVFHVEQYTHSHPDCDIAADYAAYRRALPSRQGGRRDSSGAGVVVADGTKRLYAEVSSPAANRYIQLPMLAAQIFATFQFRTINHLSTKATCTTSSARRAENAVNGGGGPVGSTGCHACDGLSSAHGKRRALYRRYFTARDRLILVTACVLLAWKQLDASAAAEFLVTGGRPRWLVEEHPSARPTSDGRNHPFTRLRELSQREDGDEARLLGEVGEMEVCVFSTLGGRVGQLPLWWTVAVDVVEACSLGARIAAVPREGAATAAADAVGSTAARNYTKAMHQLVSLAQCVLAESRPRPGVRPGEAEREQLRTAQRRAREGLAVSRQNTTAGMAASRLAMAGQEEEEEGSTEGTATGKRANPFAAACSTDEGTSARLELAAMWHSPFFGVALAVVAGVPLEWAERHVLGLPSAHDVHIARSRECVDARCPTPLRDGSGVNSPSSVDKHYYGQALAAAAAGCHSAPHIRHRRLDQVGGDDTNRASCDSLSLLHRHRSAALPGGSESKREMSWRQTSAPETAEHGELHKDYALRITRCLRDTVCNVIHLTRCRTSDGRCYAYEERLAQALSDDTNGVWQRR